MEKVGKEVKKPFVPWEGAPFYTKPPPSGPEFYAQNTPNAKGSAFSDSKAAPKGTDFFDPLGGTEPDNTVYTLTVRCPKRPPPKYLPAFFTREPVRYTHAPGAYIAKPPETNPNLDCFESKHLDDMNWKAMKLKGGSSRPR